MSVVYQAHDTKLGRDVALKFVTPVGEQESEFSNRLRREAKSLAALSHPNIVTIHDIDEVDGVPFLVLEWINGKPLSHPSFARPLSTEEFRSIALSVADALGAAHEGGIIHRDVKPSNVLISNEGRTKVLDFGLAKFRSFNVDLIRTAGTVGTIGYMSPEQASGAELGPPSDVFSFGILAYQLLTNQPPFRGNGPGVVLSAIMSGKHTPLIEVRKDLPGELVAIVERCLENDPDRRFQNGTELSGALRGSAHYEMSGAVEQATTRVFTTPPWISSGAPQQDIRFCTTSDGVHLAYSIIGTGPLLVRVLGHFTHLEMEWEWPDLRLFWERLAERLTVVRYDGRGIGLSDRYFGEFTEQSRQLDLDAVLKAAGAEKAILLGISEGGWTAAIYAARNPGLVTHLVLYGAYSRGAQARPDYDKEEDEALVTLMRKGWGRDTPAFRQVFASQFFRSDVDPKLLAYFNDMQRASADPETAARYHESCHSRGDGADLFRQVSVPTLVVHCRDDMAVNAEEGRLLASLIPGAQLVLLPSGIHYFPADPDIVVRVVRAITRFIEGAEAH